MRSATLLLVSCVLISFILGHAKEVEAELNPMGQCGRKDIFLGGCGSNGNKTCINDFVKKGGASSKPNSCECDNFGEEHLCRCYFPC
ncbi:unnamed protein product [Arabidopsis halleri]